MLVGESDGVQGENFYIAHSIESANLRAEGSDGMQGEKSSNEHFRTEDPKAERYKNECGNVDDFIDKSVTRAMDQMWRRQELQWESTIDETCRSIRSEFGLTQHERP